MIDPHSFNSLIQGKSNQKSKKVNMKKYFVSYFYITGFGVCDNDVISCKDIKTKKDIRAIEERLKQKIKNMSLVLLSFHEL